MRLGVDRASIHFSRHRPVRTERLQFGGKQQTSVHARVVERLLPEAVAGQHETPPRRVPEAKGKHPVEVLDDGCAPLAVRLDDDFRVGARTETMTARP